MNAVYDRLLIGKRIASGGDRRVYRYSDDRVIKISSLHFLTGDKLHKKLSRDYQTCKFYLPEFVVETHDVTPGGGRHTEIQPLIQGEPLSRKHCENVVIREQLKKIRNVADRMEQDGHPLIDLIGHHGMITSVLSNILVDKNNRLRIVDTTLLEGKSLGPLGIILDIITPLIRLKQNYLLNKFLHS